MNARNYTASPVDCKTGSWDNGAFTHKNRRSKTDWAGLGVGDAFKSTLEYFLRVAAQRMFYAGCRKCQLAAAQLAGATVAPHYQPKAKPQLGPCYTTYPGTLAAYAAIGLTGFLEFQASASRGVLMTHLAEYLKDPAGQDKIPVDPDFYKTLCHVVARTVQTRLLLEDLARSPGLSTIELYRLFSASQQSFRFETVPEMVDAVVLYGDILPDWTDQDLHAITRSILDDLDSTCRPYFTRLATSQPHELTLLGIDWVRAVCKRLSRYLPPLPAPKSAPQRDSGGTRTGDKPKESFAEPGQPPAPDERIAPLSGPHAPYLFDPPGAAERAAETLRKTHPETDGEENPSTEATQAAQRLEHFAKALDQAGGQNKQWEDMRYDLVERAMTTGTFCESPMQGSPADGHEVKIRLDKEQVAGGEIHDRPVELSEDLPALDRLTAEAKPIADALRRTLYPNVEELVETERLLSTGALDPGRLAMADYSMVVFRRYRINEKADRKGQPLLLIACDGSGSLNHIQMRMLKVLAAAWLNSTARTRVQVMAGLYHSGEVRKDIAGPLVQWIYHPHKTPAISRKDAVRALVTLPDTGTGTQSDALSLAFMMSEASKVARGRMIYLILITDCQWNKCLPGERSGKEEVRVVFENIYEKSAENLHATLVALGSSGQTGFEDLVDKVIAVPESKLADYAGMAEEIGVYVASCIRERRRFVTKE